MTSRISTFRSCVCALALFCVAAAGIAQTHAASSPAILRMDAFIAAPYDANTALVFFNTSVMPAGLGVPVGAWPQGASAWAGSQARLWLANSGETQWRHYWPGGESNAPKLGGQYALALGGNRVVRGTLSSIGYLPVCDAIWLVGLIRVDEVDRTRYANEAAEGMVTYLSNGAPNPDSGSGQDAPAIGSTVAKDRIVNVFPLAAVPMLDQGDGGNQTILLTEERTADSVVYSLKRRTPGALVPAGVYFENRCR
jgi:hypothetical protein